MLFEYRAIGTTGRRVRGRMDALHLPDLENRLRRMDLDLIDGKPAGDRQRLGRGGIPRREMINFLFHLEQLLRSGVPILEGLADLQESLTHPRFRRVTASLLEGIAGGQTLSQAMAAHPHAFSPVLASLVEAGETAGRLPDVLASLAESLKWEDELASHTRKVLLYPALLGAAALATALFLMLHLVPQLKPFIHAMGRELPLHTRALFFLSDLAVDHWQALLIAPAAILLAGRLAVGGNPAARLWLDAAKLRLPIVGAILHKIILSRFAGTFAMLYGAGIPILAAIRSAQGIVGNRLVQRALEDIEAAVQEGRNLAGAFRDAGLFPPLVVRMVGIGENTGNLDEALGHVSYFYTRDVREAVEKAHALMEPALTLLMGALLGWVMLAVMGPIYDIVGRAGL